MNHRAGFATRLVWAMAALLLAFGLLVGALVHTTAGERELESLQRLSYGLARHIVGHWPGIAEADLAARDALLTMLMVVNPGIQVYLLDADGRVTSYLGEPGMVQQHQVDLAPVHAFLAGAAMPVRGTDPMGSGVGRIFSAAGFPHRDGETRAPGYLYVVLDGQARERIAGQTGMRRVWLGAGLAGLGALAVVALFGVFLLRRMTLPLRRLACEIRDYRLRPLASALPPEPDATCGPQHLQAHVVAPAPRRDEVQAIADAFADMRQRIEAQNRHAHEQTLAHQEVMASVAHDLRTPLTALHGHLEVLAQDQPRHRHLRRRLLQAALAQSDKVRRLSQQLFELAALQSCGEILHRESFLLDELVADAVQKFALTGTPSPVTLAGESPGSLAFDGDLHLIERALTNLIDNAVRHAPGPSPVRVRLRREGASAQILVEDEGPGLPQALAARLASGRPMRDAPMLRSSGGMGGLGLAIAQRVAVLHGGSLRPFPTAHSGTTLCLALPLVA